MQTEKKWNDNIQFKCRMCGNLNKEILCPACKEKLQTSFGQVCLKCGNYKFVPWTEENVKRLAQNMGLNYDFLWNIDRIVVIPTPRCPKCCELSKHCKSENTEKVSLWN